ncbi:MAG: hypothetical protein ACK459_15240 [Akkermansiaceae bacterium]|jgi:hypothetical protein
MPQYYLFFTLKKHTMKKWYKSKINILGLLLVLVGVLEAADANLLGYLGIANPEKWMSILGVVLVALRQMTSSGTTPILKVGGRKKRKKKPTGLPQDGAYTFEGNDFTTNSVATYTSDVVSQYPIEVASIFNSENSQTVFFSEEIQYKDFESLFFEVEVG